MQQEFWLLTQYETNINNNLANIFVPKFHAVVFSMLTQTYNSHLKGEKWEFSLEPNTSGHDPGTGIQAVPNSVFQSSNNFMNFG